MRYIVSIRFDIPKKIALLKEYGERIQPRPAHDVLVKGAPFHRKGAARLFTKYRSHVPHCSLREEFQQ